MSEPTAMELVSYLLVLILPLSALAARRLPPGSVLKMALGWIAIFGVLAILVGQRERFRPLWEGALAAVGGEDQVVTGGTVRIPMAGDGHFWATARINGVAVRLLVDSGASTTGLSAATARSAGIAPDSDFGTAVETANGRVVAARATARTVQLGGIVARDLPVLTSPAFGDTSVLGMNFLSRLQSWRVEGRTLILEAGSG